MLLKQTAAPMRLIPYMLAGGSLEGITEHYLRCMLTTQGAAIQKRKSEKSVTKRTLLWSVLLAEHGDKSPEEQATMFMKFFGQEAQGQEKPILPDALTQQALSTLPFDEVRTEYAGLKDRLDRLQLEERFKDVITREKGEHARKEFETPLAVKQLKPEGAKVVLCMDRKNNAFEAYFPGGKPTKSVSCSWNKEGRTMLSALTFCIEYLWRNQESKKKESRHS